MIDRYAVIRKYLKKNKEVCVVELVVSNYNEKNYYISLIYNSRIEKFKVLYVPIDLMDSKNIEDYCCYQFIKQPTVNYIIDSFKDNKKFYKKHDFCDRLNKYVDNYNITINYYIDDETITFKTYRVLPKEWMFMYDIINILFEHCPNIISELGNDILGVLNNMDEMIDYKKSIDFDLFHDTINDDNYKNLAVSYLEFVNDKYYGIVDNELVIINYNKVHQILNMCCSKCDTICNHLYSVVNAIRENYSNKYYKLIVTDDKNNYSDYTGKFKYYLCYGVDEDGVKIIEHSSLGRLPFSIFKDGLVKISNDSNSELKKDLEKYLINIYGKSETSHIINNIDGIMPK